jgi:predicted  nucleic acid-binding Zn-ribbon protein
MTEKDQHLINKLKQNIRRLIDSLEKTKDELEQVKDEKNILQLQVKSCQNDFEAITKRYENLKVVKALADGDPDNQAAKQKINKLIREVDKCIALLNQ